MKKNRRGEEKRKKEDEHEGRKKCSAGTSFPAQVAAHGKTGMGAIAGTSQNGNACMLAQLGSRQHICRIRGFLPCRNT